MKTLLISILVLFTSSFVYSQKNGDTKAVTAVSHLRAQASWDGCSAGSDQQESLYNPPPGWAIVCYKTSTHSCSNGSKSVSVIAYFAYTHR